MDKLVKQIERFRELHRAEANMDYDLRVEEYVQFLAALIQRFEDDLQAQLRNANIDLNRWTLNQ